MKHRIIVIVVTFLIAANILYLSIKSNVADAAVTCVDKYNYASVIPCSDQNAIVAPSSGSGNMTTGSNMTAGSGVITAAGNMTAGGNMTSGNMTPTTITPQTPSPSAQPSPPVQTQQQGLVGRGWWGPCNTVRSYLLQSCSQLVNPDGTLTSQGDRAVGCIRNGAGFALGGISQGLPISMIISGLRMAEGPTGCGGIVNWDQIQSVAQLQLFVSLFGH